MKRSKYLALAVALGAFTVVSLTYLTYGQGSTPTPTPPAYRGNLAVPGQQGSITLNTGYQPTAVQQSILRHNLGEVLGTGTATYVNGYATDQTVVTGDNAFITPYPGLVVRSGSGFKLCLSPTNGVLIAVSGTVATVTALTGTGSYLYLP